MNNYQKNKKAVVFKGKEFDVFADKILSDKPVNTIDFKNNILYKVPYKVIVKLGNKLNEGKRVDVISEIKKYKRIL
jgi:hypothetical protein